MVNRALTLFKILYRLSREKLDEVYFGKIITKMKLANLAFIVLPKYFVYRLKLFRIIGKWDKVFKNEPSKTCGRNILKSVNYLINIYVYIYVYNLFKQTKPLQKFLKTFFQIFSEVHSLITCLKYHGTANMLHSLTFEKILTLYYCKMEFLNVLFSSSFFLLLQEFWSTGPV